MREGMGGQGGWYLCQTSSTCRGHAQAGGLGPVLVRKPPSPLAPPPRLFLGVGGRVHRRGLGVQPPQPHN